MKTSKLLMLSSRSLLLLLMGYSSIRETLQGRTDQNIVSQRKEKNKFFRFEMRA